MTPVEIIALARAQFGEASAMSVSETSARDFLNAAILEIYEDLPSDRLKNLLSVTSVILTAGKGSVDPTWDKILEVYVDGEPASVVARDTISHYDYSDYFTTIVPITHIDDDSVWVRPDTGACTILHLDPPTEVTAGNEGTEYTSIDDIWHPALADLVTAAMYAQEEDVQQAEQYRAAYKGKLGMLLAPEPVE